MTRRCSHCSNNGHNSRTCPTRSSGGSGGGLGPKIFGVRLDGSIIKKSASMGNLSSVHYHSSSSAAASPNPDSPSSDLIRDQMIHVSDGYLSDDPAHASVSANRRAERKKGIPWTEEEHRRFLVGLQNLGKGDWRGIARNFVVSRTPTQVASHAQKYFIRHSSTTRRKRRSSLFDMASDMAMDTPPVPEEQLLPPPPQSGETDHPNSVLSLNLSLGNEFEPMDATSHEVVKEREENVEPSSSVLSFAPVYYQTYIPPAGYSFMPSNLVPAEEDKGETSHHQVLKPIPILPKEPLNVDELVGMSQLSLGEIERGRNSSSPLSLKLVLGGPSRQSAFHANTPVSGSELSDGKSSAIQAI